MRWHECSFFCLFCTFIKCWACSLERENLSFTGWILNMCIHVLTLLKLLTFDYKWNIFFHILTTHFYLFFCEFICFVKFSANLLMSLSFSFLYIGKILVLSATCTVAFACILKFDLWCIQISTHLLGGISTILVTQHFLSLKSCSSFPLIFILLHDMTIF